MKKYCDFIELVRKMAVPNDSDSYRAAIKRAMELGILSNYLKQNSTETPESAAKNMGAPLEKVLEALTK